MQAYIVICKSRKEGNGHGDAEAWECDGGGYPRAYGDGRQAAAGAVSLSGGRLPERGGGDPRLSQRPDPAGYGTSEAEASPDQRKAYQFESGGHQAPSEIARPGSLRAPGIRLRRFSGGLLHLALYTPGNRIKEAAVCRL